MRLLLLLIGLFAATPSFAGVPRYALVKDKSSLTFVAFMNGAPVAGKFDDFTADIHFDPNQPAKSSIRVEVNTSSVSVENDDVLKNIQLPDWLSVVKFPTAVLICNGLSRFPQTDDYYAGFNGAGDCELTLRGRTLPVELNFQMEHFDGGTAIANGYVTLHRLDFGIGQGQWAKDDVIKDEVRVNFRVTAEKK
ncbi:MAG: YceI family protein [Pseudomonadota bacterium]|nr:YceI family protein [Pseudomonadota bacterium]